MRFNEIEGIGWKEPAVFASKMGLPELQLAAGIKPMIHNNHGSVA